MIFLPADKRNIIQTFLAGRTTSELADQYGVARKTIETVYREAIVQLSQVAVENAEKAILFKMEADRTHGADEKPLNGLGSED